MQNKKNVINRYLIILIICLSLFLLLIIFFYIHEKNIIVQKHLKDIQYKLEKHQKKYSNMISDKHKVSYSNNIVIVKEFLDKY